MYSLHSCDPEDTENTLHLVVCPHIRAQLTAATSLVPEITCTSSGCAVKFIPE